MEKIITYKANDGTSFNNERDCRTYEQGCEQIAKIPKNKENLLIFAKEIQKICKSTFSCKDCYFYNSHIEECTFCDEDKGCFTAPVNWTL